MLLLRQTNRTESEEDPVPEPEAARPTATPIRWRTRLWWVLLAFIPSSLMLGVTTFDRWQRLDREDSLVWTDDFSNILSVFYWD